jgi:hypothetical protein
MNKYGKRKEISAIFKELDIFYTKGYTNLTVQHVMAQPIKNNRDKKSRSDQ